jgi:hypothetical protein
MNSLDIEQHCLNMLAQGMPEEAVQAFKTFKDYVDSNNLHPNSNEYRKHQNIAFYNVGFIIGRQLEKESAKKYD